MNKVESFLTEPVHTNLTWNDMAKAYERAACDAVEDLVHSRNDLPRDGSAVVAQTVSGTIILGRFHESESVGCFLQLTRFNIFPWGSVLRWFYPKDVFGEDDGI